jgi:hypothetical protein
MCAIYGKLSAQCWIYSIQNRFVIKLKYAGHLFPRNWMSINVSFGGHSCWKLMDKSRSSQLLVEMFY